MKPPMLQRLGVPWFWRWSVALDEAVRAWPYQEIGPVPSCDWCGQLLDHQSAIGPVMHMDGTRSAVLVTWRCESCGCTYEERRKNPGDALTSRGMATDDKEGRQ